MSMGLAVNCTTGKLIVAPGGGLGLGTETDCCDSAIATLLADIRIGNLRSTMTVTPVSCPCMGERIPNPVTNPPSPTDLNQTWTNDIYEPVQLTAQGGNNVEMSVTWASNVLVAVGQVNAFLPIRSCGPLVEDRSYFDCSNPTNIAGVLGCDEVFPPVRSTREIVGTITARLERSGVARPTTALQAYNRLDDPATVATLVAAVSSTNEGIAPRTPFGQSGGCGVNVLQSLSDFSTYTLSHVLGAARWEDDGEDATWQAQTCVADPCPPMPGTCLSCGQNFGSFSGTVPQVSDAFMIDLHFPT